MNCDDASVRMAAYCDGELDAVASADVERHAAGCARCGQQRAALLDLGKRIREEVPYHTAPKSLRERLMAPASTAPRVRGPWRWAGLGAAFGAAATALAIFVAGEVLQRNEHDALSRQVVANHVRSSLTGQRVAVVSSDRHTVKPWLSARLDFAPPVKDLAEKGYSLEGARIEALDGHAVAALVYRHRNHTIDVFVRPESGADVPPSVHTFRGFNVARARGAEMAMWIVSDLNVEELTAFAADIAHRE
jgi:anti-sigma factor RsiW